MLGTAEEGAPGAQPRLLVLAGVVALALVLLGVSSAPAAADVFRVKTTANGGPDSLRRAIAGANNHTGLDQIRFRIPGAGVQTIKPTSELPTITDPVTVDGYTQPGASPNTLATGNDAVLRIELNGVEAGQFATGLAVATHDTVVRGLVINRFGDGFGVVLSGATNRVVGNFIGTNAAGTLDRGNGDGVVIVGSEAENAIAAENTIGGTVAADRNLVSGNSRGIGIAGFTGATGNEILGNYVGTERDGSDALPNGTGVSIANQDDNTIGGTVGGARNVISGNIDAGVVLSRATGNQVQGNFIGTAADGTTALGNGDLDAGVEINGGDHNTIGGTTPDAGNRIAHNAGDGVFVTSGAGHRVLSNEIFSNGGLGIDLGLSSAGVTANDSDDPDTGANNLQNFPVITSATWSESDEFTTIRGTLNSTPSESFTIQCFRAAPDPSGHGEGRIPLGQTTATTNADGDDNSFTCFTPRAQPGQVVTATATNMETGDTSEFSQNVGVTSVP